MITVKSFVGVLLALSGLFLVVFGNAWAPSMFALTPDSVLGEWVDLFLPYLPMAFIGFGALLYTSRR